MDTIDLDFICSELMLLTRRVRSLEQTVTNLQQECQRLYQTGFSNGKEVARTEYADQLEKLEALGFISCHGFLKSEPNEVFDKLRKLGKED